MLLSSMEFTIIRNGLIHIIHNNNNNILLIINIITASPREWLLF